MDLIHILPIVHIMSTCKYKYTQHIIFFQSMIQLQSHIVFSCHVSLVSSLSLSFITFTSLNSTDQLFRIIESPSVGVCVMFPWDRIEVLHVGIENA